ncbi:MAG: hypothetical protein IPO78_01230 [Saprospiraceae bacterium]|nr:hypothetical protein [Saprospiraceae bacterium]
MKLYDKSIIKAQMTQTTNKSLRGLLSLSILFMGSLLLIGTILDQLGVPYFNLTKKSSTNLTKAFSIPVSV